MVDEDIYEEEEPTSSDEEIDGSPEENVFSADNGDFYDGEEPKKTIPDKVIDTVDTVNSINDTRKNTETIRGKIQENKKHLGDELSGKATASNASTAGAATEGAAGAATAEGAAGAATAEGAAGAAAAEGAAGAAAAEGAAGAAAAEGAGAAVGIGYILLWVFLIILIIIASIGMIGAVVVLLEDTIGIDVEGELNEETLNTYYSDYSVVEEKGTAEYYWPIGSSTTTGDDILFATGKPVTVKITSRFGVRTDPLTGKTKKHNGVDIASSGGAGNTNVIAAKSGVVVKINNNCTSYGNKSCGGGYGNYVMISHSDGKYTFYAHLHQNSITVKKNDNVTVGQVIAKVGSSGRSTGPHLHFEVRTSTTNRVNPLDYISEKNTRPRILDN